MQKSHIKCLRVVIVMVVVVNLIVIVLKLAVVKVTQRPPLHARAHTHARTSLQAEVRTHTDSD